MFIWSGSKHVTWLKPIASDSSGALNPWEEDWSRCRAVGNVFSMAWPNNNLPLQHEFTALYLKVLSLLEEGGRRTGLASTTGIPGNNNGRVIQS